MAVIDGLPFNAWGRNMIKPRGSTTHSEALHLFNCVCDAWGLPIAARLILLGKEPNSSNTYRSWIRRARSGLSLHLDRDVVDRIAYVVGTFESSTLVWGATDASYRWITTVSRAPEFAGAPPLFRMLRGGMEDLRATWAYISSIANGVDGQPSTG